MQHFSSPYRRVEALTLGESVELRRAIDRRIRRLQNLKRLCGQHELDLLTPAAERALARHGTTPEAR